MCLFKFDKEKYEDTLKREAEKEGERKGEFKALIELVKKGLLSLQQASEQMNMSLEKFEREAKNLALL